MKLGILFGESILRFTISLVQELWYKLQGSEEKGKRKMSQAKKKTSQSQVRGMGPACISFNILSMEPLRGVVNFLQEIRVQYSYTRTYSIIG